MTALPRAISEPMRAAILASFPELANATFTPLPDGWHSLAIDVDDRLIFKFPRSSEAEAALRREAALLAVIRPAVTMTVPDIVLHHGPPLFSVHGKIKGRHLLMEDYAALTNTARDQIAADIAQFYAELHRLPHDRVAAAGAGPIIPWQTPANMRAKALPHLPPELRPAAETVIASYELLPPDPHGMVYGFFDGHGWNMAFDLVQQQLNGIYDFADSGFGGRHQEFIYTNLIACDLTARVVSAYERLTGLDLDRERIDILSGTHRLSELAELADDPSHAPAMVRHVADWLSRAPRRG